MRSLLRSACLFLLAVPGEGIAQVPVEETSVIRDLRAIRTDVGIEVLEQVELGGVPQWVSIRGQDRANPVILFIHGGPGDPGIGLSWAFQRGWEEFFTVVQWDQRGGGKNVSGIDLESRVPDPELTIQRLAGDAEELVGHLRDRLGHEQVLVVAHSWGNVLGTYLAARRPEWLRAIVAVGHIGAGMRGNEAAVYDAVLARARSVGNRAAEQELESIAPYPPSSGPIPPAHMVVRGRWISALGGSLHGEPRGLEVYYSAVSVSPDYTAEERERWPQAASRVIGHLVQDGFFEIDLERMGTSFDMPVFFFHGRHDLHTPLGHARSYFERLVVPDKAFFTFERSAHSPHLEEPGLFLIRLLEVHRRTRTESGG